MNKFRMPLIITVICIFMLTTIFSCKKSDDNSSKRPLESTESKPDDDSREVSDAEPVDKIEQESISLDFDYGVFDKDGGGKFIIAVVISGKYFEFSDAFKSMLNGLIKIGWASEEVDLSEIVTTEELIRYVNSHKFSDKISFPEELFFDLMWGHNNDPMKSALIDNYASKDIDLIISLGGIASRIFAAMGEDYIPVLVDAVTDPLEAGIVLNNEDSGKKFLTCRTDPEQFRRQVRLFYDTVKFERLGIIYGDDETGRIYGAVSDVEAVAEEKGFEIIRNTNVFEDPTPEQMERCARMYLEALEEICPRVDALYLGASAGITDGDIREIVKVINKHKVPAFALEGSIRVVEGILFGISMSGQVRAGAYNAKKMVAIFKGDEPRSLPQLFENVPSIAINLKTATTIGYDIPTNVIAGSDEVYTDF